MATLIGDVMNRRTNKRLFYEIPKDSKEYEDTINNKVKVSRILRALERIDQERYTIEHKNGYCPICHMLIPLSGECDCGYKK